MDESLRSLAERRLAELRGEGWLRDRAGTWRNRTVPPPRNGEVAAERRVPSLEDRILAALAGGSRLRAREIAERVGVPKLDTGNPVRLLRMLPGSELFDALARLWERGEVATDSASCLWWRSEDKL